MRHLFIDDGELTRVERLYRRVHQPRRHPDNPVLDGDTPWETHVSVYGTTLYDEERGLFRRWYLTSPGSNEERVSVGPAGGRVLSIPGNVTLLGYATSTDGVHWEKPDLGQMAIAGDSHNNILHIGRLNCEGASIIEDPDDPDPDKRFKAFYWEHGGDGTLTKLPGGRVLFGTGDGDGMWISHSPDGVRWTNYATNPAIALGSDTDQTVLRDPALHRYVAFGRFNAGGRKMARAESDDFVHWTEPELVFECDEGDEAETQFYGVPIDLYEGLYLGMPWIYREGVDGTIDTQLAVSRDGIDWQRVGARETFLSLGAPGGPEDGMCRVGKRFIVRGDQIYLFYGAVQGPHGGRKFSGNSRATGLCLALLRRDGFVSMSGDGDGGWLLTRPVAVDAGRGEAALHLNVNARGRAVVTLCDDDGVPIEGFEPSRAVSGDHTDVTVAWPDRQIGALAGQRLRLRIELHEADLFSFWLECMAPAADSEPNAAPAAGHPRVYFTAESLERLRGQADSQAFAPLLATMRERAQAALAEPMPEVVLPDDLLLPGEPTWDQRYPRDEETFAAHERMMYPLRALYVALPATAFVAMLDGDRACRDYAVAGMRHLAGLDLERTSYLNTHQFHGVVPSVSQALDYLWDDLGADRSFVVTGLAARAGEFHAHSVLNTFDNPLDSHSIVYGPPEMAVAALALYHHVPEAAGWLADVERFLAEAFPGYGGADGGWGQGFGYVYSHYFQRIAHLFRVATGADHFDRPWGRNNGRHFLYFRPPWSTCTSFGDASYSTHPALNRQIMGMYGRVYGDPVYRWYAEQVEDGDAAGRDPLAELSARLTWPEPPAATPPHELPRSVHFADTGWVALHSDLTSREANVMLCFKSSRFGSFSHSHADQNSFVLEAFGRSLLIDSGFYPWYGSPHDLAWTRHTRAHNAVLVDDRGQAVWRVEASGRIIAFATGPDYDYCAGDATAAYGLESHEHTHRPLRLSERSAAELGVERAIRHVIFLRPAVFVVIDDVVTREPRPVQLAFHAPVPFEVPAPAEANGGVTAAVGNPPALARLTFCAEPGAAAARLARADRFPVDPERSDEQEYPRSGT